MRGRRSPGAHIPAVSCVRPGVQGWVGFDGRCFRVAKSHPCCMLRCHAIRRHRLHSRPSAVAVSVPSFAENEVRQTQNPLPTMENSRMTVQSSHRMPISFSTISNACQPAPPAFSDALADSVSARCVGPIWASLAAWVQVNRQGGKRRNTGHVHPPAGWTPLAHSRVTGAPACSAREEKPQPRSVRALLKSALAKYLRHSLSHTHTALGGHARRRE
jgi:hypothetical protein